MHIDEHLATADAASPALRALHTDIGLLRSLERERIVELVNRFKFQGNLTIFGRIILQRLLSPDLVDSDLCFI